MAAAGTGRGAALDCVRLAALLLSPFSRDLPVGSTK